LKSTQEDPWQVFARTHAIGQYAPGKVTKIVPFGAFVRVADGIEGLVHISELSAKHIDLASQVVTVNQDVFVKVIDIDLDRRRISLSLKQATEEVNPESTDFNPALYGLATDFDDQGNYKYPDGFDSATSEWKPGFEDAKAKWEKEYSEAQGRWEDHKKQVKAFHELEASLPDTKPEEAAATTTSSSSEGVEASAGTLSADESLSALRDKLNEAE
jgi:small subunit ribosomal protein S1